MAKILSEWGFRIVAVSDSRGGTFNAEGLDVEAVTKHKDDTKSVIDFEGGKNITNDELLEMEVRGRNLAEGVPRSFTLNSNEILESLQEPLAGIIGAVRIALEQTPPELGADIAEKGMVLTGGGALLRDLDKLLSEETGLPVMVAEDPLTCVARGGGKALEMMDELGTDLFSME